MAEIRELPWNGFNVVSTFSGCGGSSLGYKMAGFRVLWASEFVPAAQEVYRANHPGTILDTRDIRAVQPSDILDSPDMLARYRGPGIPMRADVLKFDFPAFDLGILFLVLMFLPHASRTKFLHKLYGQLNPGGALVIVDKIEPPGGYPGTILRRMSLGWKLDAGAAPDAILKKELSLAGYQRPISEGTLPGKPCRFFQMAEFAGWIIEKPLEG